MRWTGWRADKRKHTRDKRRKRSRVCRTGEEDPHHQYKRDRQKSQVGGAHCQGWRCALYGHRGEGKTIYSYDYIKEQIKERVPLTDVIERYVGEKPNRRKLRCPFHGEKTASFTVYPNNTYYCFGCSESGDVITFVRRWFHLGFADALRRIDADFALGLFGRQTLTAHRRARAEQERRQKERRQQREAAALADARYWAAFDLVRHYETVIERQRPAPGETPSPAFIDAIKHIDRAQYRLEEWEQERRNVIDNYGKADRENDSNGAVE